MFFDPKTLIKVKYKCQEQENIELENSMLRQWKVSWNKVLPKKKVC